MITVDLETLDLAGKRVLDLGCGNGRHTFAFARAGAHVVAADLAAEEVQTTREWLDAMQLEGEIPAGSATLAMRANAYTLPYADGAFDVILASEILEHLPEDGTAMAEIVRVLRPDGELVVTVPAFGPEVVCWALSHAYHNVPGGHVRIYRQRQLLERLDAVGLRPVRNYRAHALHSPYWWLKCAVGPTRDVLPVRVFHKLLVWEIISNPLPTRVAERVLSPVLGKSLILHLRRAELAA